MRWVFSIWDLNLWLGKAFPSRLLRKPLPLRAGGVPQRPQVSPPAPAPVSLRLRADPPSPARFEALQMSQMQTALAATYSSAPSQVRAAIKPPQSPRLASLREWQARQFLRPPWTAPLLEEIRRCLPPFLHEALAHSSTAALGLRVLVKCRLGSRAIHRLKNQTPAYHSLTSVRAKEIDFIFCMAVMSSFWRALRSP